MAMEPELLKHLFKKRATLLYPFEKIEPPEHFRGKHVWYEAKCTGCGLCAKDCPSGAITMVKIEVKEEEVEEKEEEVERTEKKRKKPKQRPVIDLSMCLFCEQCVESCPTDALTMTNEYELAGYDRRKMKLYE